MPNVEPRTQPKARVGRLVCTHGGRGASILPAKSDSPIARMEVTMDIMVSASHKQSDIQAILDNPIYGTVTFAPGKYLLESPLFLRRPICITGATPYQTLIYNVTASTNPVDKAVFIVRLPNSSPQLVGAIDTHISGFFLDSQREPSIRIEYVQNVCVERVTFQNGGIYVVGSQLFYLSQLLMAGGCGLILDGSTAPLLQGTISDFLIYGASPHGIEIIDSVDVVRIINGEVNQTKGGKAGIFVWNKSGQPSGKFCHFQHIYCTQNDGDSFVFQDTSSHRLYNCYSEGGPPLPTLGNRRTGFRMERSIGLYLNACRASSHGLAGFFLQDSSGCVFSDCEALDNGDAGFYMQAVGTDCSFNTFSGCKMSPAGGDMGQAYGFYFTAADPTRSHRGIILSNCFADSHSVANYGLGSVTDSVMRDCLDVQAVPGAPSKISWRNGSV
ncbi:MAG: right-handed parallel beta-helix repeat-containing protein [Halobacteriota archaeon]